jgi:hypothetical protein
MEWKYFSMGTVSWFEEETGMAYSIVSQTGFHRGVSGVPRDENS